MEHRRSREPDRDSGASERSTSTKRSSTSRARLLHDLPEQSIAKRASSPTSILPDTSKCVLGEVNVHANKSGIARPSLLQNSNIKNHHLDSSNSDPVVVSDQELSANFKQKHRIGGKRRKTIDPHTYQEALNEITFPTSEGQDSKSKYYDDASAGKKSEEGELSRDNESSFDRALLKRRKLSRRKSSMKTNISFLTDGFEDALNVEQSPVSTRRTANTERATSSSLEEQRKKDPLKRKQSAGANANSSKFPDAFETEESPVKNEFSWSPTGKFWKEACLLPISPLLQNWKKDPRFFKTNDPLFNRKHSKQSAEANANSSKFQDAFETEESLVKNCSPRRTGNEDVPYISPLLEDPLNSNQSAEELSRAEDDPGIVSIYSAETLINWKLRLYELNSNYGVDDGGLEYPSIGHKSSFSTTSSQQSKKQLNSRTVDSPDTKTDHYDGKGGFEAGGDPSIGHKSSFRITKNRSQQSSKQLNSRTVDSPDTKTDHYDGKGGFEAGGDPSIGHKSSFRITKNRSQQSSKQLNSRTVDSPDTKTDHYDGKGGFEAGGDPSIGHKSSFRITKNRSQQSSKQLNSRTVDSPDTKTDHYDGKGGFEAGGDPSIGHKSSFRITKNRSQQSSKQLNSRTVDSPDTKTDHYDGKGGFEAGGDPSIGHKSSFRTTKNRSQQSSKQLNSRTVDSPKTDHYDGKGGFEAGGDPSIGHKSSFRITKNRSQQSSKQLNSRTVDSPDTKTDHFDGKGGFEAGGDPSIGHKSSFRITKNRSQQSSKQLNSRTVDSTDTKTDHYDGKGGFEAGGDPSIGHKSSFRITKNRSQQSSKQLNSRTVDSTDTKTDHYYGKGGFEAGGDPSIGHKSSFRITKNRSQQSSKQLNSRTVDSTDTKTDHYYGKGGFEAGGDPSIGHKSSFRITKNRSQQSSKQLNSRTVDSPDTKTDHYDGKGGYEAGGDPSIGHKSSFRITKNRSQQSSKQLNSRTVDSPKTDHYDGKGGFEAGGDPSIGHKSSFRTTKNRSQQSSKQLNSKTDHYVGEGGFEVGGDDIENGVEAWLNHSGNLFFDSEEEGYAVSAPKIADSEIVFRSSVQENDDVVTKQIVVEEGTSYQNRGQSSINKKRSASPAPLRSPEVAKKKFVPLFLRGLPQASKESDSDFDYGKSGPKKSFAEILADANRKNPNFEKEYEANFEERRKALAAKVKPQHRQEYIPNFFVHGISPIIPKQPVKPKPVPKAVHPDLLVDGKVWRPPKLAKLPRWCSNKLIGMVERECVSRYGEEKKVRKAHKFLLEVADNVKKAVRCKKNFEVPVNNVRELLLKMDLIYSLNDFHAFVEDFMPGDFRYKAIPSLRAYGLMTGPKLDPNVKPFAQLKF